MYWNRVALGADAVLGILLLVRLLRLNLHRVYLVFSALVVLQLLGSSLVGISYLTPHHVDYRRSFISFTALSWLVLLWMVYVFLSAVLKKLPGVLRFSRGLLNGSFIVAALVALLSTWKSLLELFSGQRTINAAVNVTLRLDQAVCTWALLMLLAVLAFVLWFPVEMPRNLILFSFGLVLYFASQIGVMLAHNFIPQLGAEYLSATATSLTGACFLYWALTITAAGEHVAVTMGHVWEPRQQQRLTEQLESMNAALVRGARR